MKKKGYVHSLPVTPLRAGMALFFLACDANNNPALKKGQALAVKLLIDYKADVAWRPINELPSHYIFADKGNTQALVYLLFAGAKSIEVCAKPEFPKISEVVELAESICSLRTQGEIFKNKEIVATIIDYALPSEEAAISR